MEQAQEAYTANISTGGMFVRGKDPRTVGTLLRFELRLDEGEPIKGVGEIVWIRAHSRGPEAPAGMGVQFGHLDESTRDRLTAAVVGALGSLGVEESSEPVPEVVVKRRSPPQKWPAPPTGASEPHQRLPSSPKPRALAKPRPTKRPGGQASRPLKKNEKDTRPSPFAISGRARTMMIILGLLLLLLLVLT